MERDTVFFESFHVGRRRILQGVGIVGLGATEGVGTIGEIGRAATPNDRSAQDGANEIEDWYDLDNVRNDLDGDYVLVNDLNVETAGYDEQLGNPEEGWEPIGNSDTPFDGTFDGNGYRIADLEVKRPEEQSVGLFGVNRETIKNVSIADVDVTGGDEVGGIVGENKGELVQSSVRGARITGDSGVGGLVGDNNREIGEDDSGIIADSSVRDTTISGGKGVGGLIGNNWGGKQQGLSVNSTQVTGQDWVGGVTGYHSGELAEASVHAVDITGEEDVGGVGGHHSSQSYVAESSVTGDTTTTGESEVGGFIGMNRGKVRASSVIGSDVTGDVVAGGFVGENHGEVRTSSVSSTDITGGNEIGGVIGKNDGELVESSFRGGDVTGNDKVGGLVGYNWDGGSIRSRGSVVASFVDDDAKISGDQSVGGLVGRNNGEVSESAVRAADIDGDDKVGGLVGRSWSGVVVESWATGSVTGDSYVGGLVGMLGDWFLKEGKEAILRDSYWDRQAITQANTVGIIEEGDGTAAIRGDTTGLSGDQMQGATAVDSMPRLNFEDTWQSVRTPPAYPVLQHAPLTAYTDEDGTVGTKGLQGAVQDWADGRLNLEQVRTVVESWNSGEPVEY